jgi:hypothetical protein
MRISKDQIPAKINVPGAVARVATGFGDELVSARWEANTSRSVPAPTSRRF